MVSSVRHASICLALLGALLTIHCGDDASSVPSANGVITAAGGEITLSGGEAKLTFPPGAVTGDVDVIIQTVQGAKVENLVTDLFELSPSGIEFKVPVTLTLKVDADKAVDGIFLAKVVGSSATPVDGFRYDSATRELSAKLGSFSLYGGFVPPPNLEDCQGCVKVKCPGQLQACEDNTDCNAILECIDSCVNNGGVADTCIEGCVSSSPGGKTLFDAMSACASKDCPSCSDTGPVPDECQACLEAVSYTHLTLPTNREV